MASPPMYHRVTYLQDVQRLVAAHPGEKLFLRFGERIERISEARGLANLLDKEEEEGWIVERAAALERFVDIDRTIGDTHGLLVYLIEITAPHAADRSASSSTSPAKKKGGGSSNLSTSLSSPDYGTGEFAQRVADKLNLAALRSSLHLHSSRLLLRHLLGYLPRRRHVLPRLRHRPTRHRLPLRVRGARLLLQPLLGPRRRHQHRPGRFVTPVNAKRVMEMGKKLKEVPLQSIRDAGDLVTDLGFRLRIDEELAVDLFEALKKAKNLLVKCWNAGASLSERSPVVKDEMPEVAKP